MKFIKLFTAIITAIFIILADYKFSYLQNVRQSITTLISPVYLLTNLPSQLYLWINEQGTSEEKLLKKNRYLNNQLINIKAKLQTHEGLILENKKLIKLLDSSYTIKEQKFILARVSSLTQSKLKKQIIINRGSKDNIKVGQIVLGADGIVGQIIQVSPFYSTIVTITDPTQHVPVKNQRNKIRGITKGKPSNKHAMNVRFIKSTLDIQIADIFLSSSIGSKFPANYPVGKVVNVNKHYNNDFLNIELTPSQNIEKLEFVLVIDK